jgi:hypothetical protein
MRGSIGRALFGAALVFAALQPAARAAFIDQSAWEQAVTAASDAFGPGHALIPVPIRLRVVSVFDGGGNVATTPDALFSNQTGGIGTLPRWSLPGAGTGASASPGMFEARLGCHSAFWPCLGAWSVTFAFEEPVWGIGGDLDYLFGYYALYHREAAIPFFQAAFESPNEGWRGRGAYRGFFGTVGPMTEFTLHFWEGLSVDDYATVSFRGSMLIVVPVSEPASAGLVACALALLMLAQASRALSPSAGWR